jgi:hypothetical protein
MQKTFASENDIQLAAKGTLPPRRASVGTVTRKLDKKSKEKEHTKLMETHELCQIVRDKVNAHAQGGHTQMADSYTFFGRPSHGITKQAFKEKLNLWSLFLTNAQLDAVFAQIDADGNGVVSFTEFLNFFGAENNFHPLYMPQQSTGGALDRRLSFLPGAAKREAKSVSKIKGGMDRIKANPKMLASGVPLTENVLRGVKSAHSKSDDARMYDPTYRNDRNGILMNGDYGRKEVTQFLSRLLQNAHAQVEGGRLYMSPMQYIEAKLTKTMLTVKRFEQILQSDLSRPLRMKAHILGTAIQHYKDSTKEDMIDTAQIIRDAALLSGKIVTMIDKNASGMRSIRNHIKQQASGRDMDTVKHPAHLAAQFARAPVPGGKEWDKHGRASSRGVGKSSVAARSARSAMTPKPQTDTHPDVRMRLSPTNLTSIGLSASTFTPDALDYALNSTSDRQRATRTASRAATAGEQARRGQFKGSTASMPKLRTSDDWPKPLALPSTNTKGKDIGGGAMVGGARLVMGGPAGGLQRSPVINSRPSTGMSSTGSYSERHGLSRAEMKEALRRKLECPGVWDLPAVV